MMKRLLLVTMGAASFLLSPAQQLLPENPVPLECIGIPDYFSFYDADGDGVKEYYYDLGHESMRRYHWKAPGCYGAYVPIAIPDVAHFGNGQYGMLLHANNDGIPDFSGFVFSDAWVTPIAISETDGTYRLMNQANSAYPLDVNHDGLPDLFAFNNTDWDILYQNPDGTFTATRIDTLSRAQADSLVARKAEEADGKFDTGGLPSLRDGMFVGEVLRWTKATNSRRQST
ncbi:FG-GAP repeat domain-containing protein [Paraprevotella clara]|uniref:FG-GAP repeat domain-containing protein n=1 Tax=Paraprevotella clara TaxID=454154 RepID=UPI002675BBD7|nr:VCBS repeat-containing protein [Paraprevotella clara]